MEEKSIEEDNEASADDIEETVEESQACSTSEPSSSAAFGKVEVLEGTYACKKKRMCINETAELLLENESNPSGTHLDISDETGEMITSSSPLCDLDSEKRKTTTLPIPRSRMEVASHPSTQKTQAMELGTDILEPNLQNNSALAEAFYRNTKEKENCRLPSSVKQTSQRLDSPYVFRDENNSAAFSSLGMRTFEGESQIAAKSVDENNTTSFSEKMDTSIINSLPSSILINIFLNLSTFVLLQRASLVCRFWNQLCRDPDLWRKINLRGQLRVSDDVLKQITSFSDRIVSVDISDTKFVTNHGIIDTVKNFRHIQTLKLSRCYNIQDSGIQAIGETCHSLKNLYLDGCYAITDNALNSIACGCPGLALLHLSQCTRVGDDGVISLAKHCPSLQQLLLDHCSKVTDQGILELTLGCPDMQYLSLMSCSVSDTSVKELVKMKNLHVLDVSIVSQLTPRSIIDVVRCCKEMECLNISLNTIMDDDCIENIARYGQNIKRLYCVSCKLSDQALQSIAKYSKRIEILDVGWCQDITDEGVQMLSRSCPSLRYLGLIRCDQVTAETMEYMVVHYPHINYSTFILESKKLLDRARREGFILDEQKISGNRP